MPTADAMAGYAATAPASIAGIGRAESLLQAVRADRRAALIAGVLGPGGCGKTALLAALRREYEAAGIPIVDVRTTPSTPVPAGAVVLIDDAHLLEPAVLQTITELVGRPGVSVIVAFRPWPRPPALTALASAIRRFGPLTVLRQLGRDEVGRRASAVMSEVLSPAMIEVLTEQTGGQPLVLDETLATLLEIGFDHSAAELRLPFEVIDRLRFVVDDLDTTDRALLHAIAAGASVETAVLSALLGLDPMLVREAVERARAGGFLLGDGRLIPLFRATLLSAEPVEGTRDIQVRLLDIHAGLGHDVVPVARALASSGIRNHCAAAVLVAAADLRLATEPAAAAALYADAVRAGAAAGDLAVRRAEAAVCVGRFDEALQLADPILADADSADLARAIDVVATVMAHRGQLGRAAELYRWLGPGRVGAAAPMAALAMLATGEAQEAQDFLAAAATRQRPTMLAGAMALIAEGIQLSLTDSYTSAISALSRAAALVDSVGGTSLLLDSPAALTGLVAIHVGEFDLAESILRRAVDQQVGGAIARPRHLLLLAWAAMLRGRDAEARTLLTDALPAGCVTEPRDEILCTALQVGLARRTGDATLLARTWHTARAVILRQPIDLFVLLPLGEFVIAAAVLGDSHLLDTHVKQAWMLLTGLAEPDLWASPLRWGCVQALSQVGALSQVSAVSQAGAVPEPGAVSQAVDDLMLHCEAMDEVSPYNGYGRALASASRCWLDIMTGAVEAARVRAAAAALQGFGLCYEAARMLHEASARCPDQRTSARLLQVARDLDGVVVITSPPAAAAHPAAGRPPGDLESGLIGRHQPARTRPAPSAPPASGRAGGVLSGREVQVARLLLRNQTYREIGERLFISPKTVEHHVARMKQRIGASRRSELFAQLRVLTESWDSV